MKNKFKIVISLICAVVCLFSFTACEINNLGESKANALLGEPKETTRVDYSELRADDYLAFKNCVEAFSADFSAFAYADYDKSDNFAVSPVSVYMALAIASQCADGNTRQEILSALNVSYEQLQTHFSTLYRSLAIERKIDGKITGLLDLSNSVWVNKSTNVKDDCVKSLSDSFYAYSYSADFANDNVNANKAVQDFVKKQTRDLIDKDFKLSPQTLFVLINTLYLKTVWNGSGDDLPFAEGKYDFTASDGSTKSAQLLQGEYVEGRAVRFDEFSTFYTRTLDNYKIKFIVPNDGYEVADVFTSQNLAIVNSLTDYNAYDEESQVSYSTRALFPEYKCKYDKDIKELLQNNFGITSLFDNCDFTSLTDSPCYCSKVCHVTDLTVDKTGVEGAAVTALVVDETCPSTFDVYEDFVVDRVFGFIITDANDVMLFSGVVNNV